MKKYLLKYKLLTTISIFIIFLGSIMEISKAFVQQQIIDSAINYRENRVLQLIVLVSIFIIGTVSVMVLESLFCNKLIKKCMLSIKKDLFNGILRKNIDVFNENNTSEYISALTNDMNIIESDYFQNLILLLGCILNFVICAITIFSVHYYYIIFVALSAWIPLFINHLFSNTLIKRKLLFSNNLANLTSNIKDIFSGFETIKIFSIEEKMRMKFHQVDVKLEDSRYKSRFVNDSCERVSFGGSLFIWMGNLIIGYYLITKGVLTVGYVIGVSQLINNIVNPLYRMPVLVNKIKTTKKIYENRLDLSQGSNNEIQNKVISYSPKKIAFHNVNLKISNKTILDNINLEFEQGKKYAIIGESGSGKSTIIKLLMRYYDNYEGSIKIDNTELKEIHSSDWYNLISMIQQNVFIFNDTMKNNITLFEDYEVENIDYATNISKIDKLVNTLPEKLDTIVNENGKNFSGGECQRISIARSLIRKPSIILLDEATSSLDMATSNEIEKDILNMKGVTVIVVTHRMNEEMQKMYDQIYVIDKGKVI